MCVCRSVCRQPAPVPDLAASASRSDLMEAIRQAGGRGRAKLRSVAAAPPPRKAQVDGRLRHTDGHTRWGREIQVLMGWEQDMVAAWLYGVIFVFFLYALRHFRPKRQRKRLLLFLFNQAAAVFP